MKIQSILRQSEFYVDLLVRVSPNASGDQITGIIEASDGQNRLAIKVRAVPEKSKANKAIIKLLAKRLQLPKSSIDLVSGATTRLKTLRISGDTNTIILTLEKLLAA